MLKLNPEDISLDQLRQLWTGTAARLDDAARRLERVLWNDPATGVMRHADAGYDIAVECAREQGLDLPMVDR